ncbi:hypothetical protein VTH82DRAFT_1816 [Thermothelomyces myriococcoides]
MAPLKRIAGALCLLLLSIGPVRCDKADKDDVDADDADITTLTGRRSETTRTSTDVPTSIFHTPSYRETDETTTGHRHHTDAEAEETPSKTVTFITGSHRSSSTTTSEKKTSSATSTSTAPPEPTNTRPCNNYPELCDRKYGNVTQVGCHNSPFVRSGSVAANQQLPVIDQLNDGVRFLQAQIQWPVNGTVPHFCHTSCDLLDAGPITDWLRQVKNWVAAHPYDVVTILLGNGNYSTPDLYAPYIEESGITKYAFRPSRDLRTIDDWPTLGQLILSGQRVIMFLDYMANQTAYPWLLDEFAYAWETPFDPTDETFPCIVHRPPNLPPHDAKKRLYIMNHNLNAQVSLLGQSLLVPAVSRLNITNAADGPGSLGMAANNCRTDWGRAPNVLNVDYYNYGNYPGSVFEVAAKMNNVTWIRRPCCGPDVSVATKVEVAKAVAWIGLVWAVWMMV